MNAMTDAKAKTGNFPFTTIKPNTGVSYIPIDCPCLRFGLSSSCQPRYGRCVNGTRYIPIRLLDVAGLVPGASQGEGLGNQFLDDLRTADALIHVVDVSGTTDASGKETVHNYMISGDPTYWPMRNAYISRLATILSMISTGSNRKYTLGFLTI